MQIDKYLPMVEKRDEKEWIKTTLVAYLRKNPENQTEIEHILDYFNSGPRPPRISKMSYKQAVDASNKWVKALNKKGLNIVETEEDVEVVHSFKTGARLVKLVSKDAYKREGALMSHCLASYDPNKEGMEIYSLRDSKNLPHCTFELQRDNGIINQVKGKGNGPIHPKYIKHVIFCLKKLGMDVRISELANLGYVEPPVDAGAFFNLMESQYDNVKYLTYQGKKLYYKYSNLKEKS